MNFIITGCASAGKTTLINYLAELGYLCHEEVSRKVIKKQLLQESSAVPWEDTEQFCHLVFKEMAKIPLPLSKSPCFMDRGLPDLIAYLKAVDAAVPPEYYAALKNANYAPIAFLLEPNQAIYVNDSERQESYEEAVFFFNAIKKTYQLLGFKLYSIPLMPVGLRAKFVLKIIELSSSSKYISC
ncbi:AAA family ATPase [Aureispira anguillae]|uniref:AAA family ATPase n=1 Tax=Aureispira anguillae TaxID=2864201 RepID=A0A915YDP2_9BACT|nr:AAA family ATPase [Aureispira anguillae]BDS11183.1 AAA family ATPase [Aureispira anguillae]